MKTAFVPAAAPSISRPGPVGSPPTATSSIEGINENNHTGSFVHKEYHRENRKRAFTALEQDVKRPAVRVTKKNTSPLSAQRSAKPKGTGAAIGAVISWLVFIFAILELFS